jgi:hypothetical protein
LGWLWFGVGFSFVGMFVVFGVVVYVWGGSGWFVFLFFFFGFGVASI